MMCIATEDLELIKLEGNRSLAKHGFLIDKLQSVLRRTLLRK